MENLIDTDNNKHPLPSFTMIAVANFLIEQKPIFTACQSCPDTEKFNQYERMLDKYAHFAANQNSPFMTNHLDIKSIHSNITIIVVHMSIMYC